MEPNMQQVLECANKNPDIDVPGSSSQVSLPCFDTVTGFQALSLVLLANLLTGHDLDLDPDEFTHENMSKKRRTSIRTAMTHLLQRCRNTSEDKLENLFWDELGDRSPYLSDALAGCQIPHKPVMRLGWPTRSARIRGTDPVAVWKAITADCISGPGDLWSSGRTYFLDGVRFDASSECEWFFLQPVCPAANRYWRKGTNPAQLMELDGYQRTARVVWIVGAANGVMQLFLFTRHGGENRVLVAGNNSLDVRKKSASERLQDVVIYAMHVQPDLNFDDVGYCVKSGLWSEYAPEKWSFQDMDRVMDEFLKVKIGAWKQDSFDPSFVDYICECLEYPALFLLGCMREGQKDSPEGALNEDIARCASLLMSYTAEPSDVGNIKHWGENWGEEQSAVLSAFKMYATFTQWVYYLVHTLRAFKNDGDDANPKEFEIGVKGYFASVPCENSYVFSAAMTLMGNIYTSIVDESALADTSQELIATWLNGSCSGDFVGEFHIERDDETNYRYDELQTSQLREKWNPMAAVKAIREVEKECKLVSERVPSLRSGSLQRVAPRSEYLEHRRRTELKCAIFL